ncbi:MAG: MFS transporter [Candidatus Kapaibacteriota bacterium]
MNVLINDPYAALRFPSFRRILIGRLFLTLSIQIQAVSIGWLLYVKTGDPLALGFSGLAEAIPYIITSMFSGYVADTKNRKHVLMAAMFFLFLASIGLLLQIMSDLNSTQSQLNTIPYYLALSCVGLSRGFMGPSLQALWADIVPKEVYPNAATWSANLFNFAAVAGPAIGGLLYGFLGAISANIAVCILIISSLTAFSFVRYTRPPQKPNTESLSNKLTAGLKFVFSHQVLVGAMALDMFAVLFGGALALLPAFTKDVLSLGPEALGILRAAPFVGSLLMGMYLAHHPPVEKTGKWLLFAVAGFGACMIGFAMSTHYYLSLILIAASGAFDNISMVIRGSIAQLLTPDEMRGRVSAINGIFIGASNEIGAFESGLAARVLGLVPSVIAGGSMTLLIVAFTSWKAPALSSFSIREHGMRTAE